MKTKIRKIWSVGLVVMLMVSLLITAAPASADVLEWTASDIPDDTGEVILDHDGILDIAVSDDGMIWAAVGKENARPLCERQRPSPPMRIPEQDGGRVGSCRSGRRHQP